MVAAPGPRRQDPPSAATHLATLGGPGPKRAVGCGHRSAWPTRVRGDFQIH